MIRPTIKLRTSIAQGHSVTFETKPTVLKQNLNSIIGCEQYFLNIHVNGTSFITLIPRSVLILLARTAYLKEIPILIFTNQRLNATYIKGILPFPSSFLLTFLSSPSSRQVSFMSLKTISHRTSSMETRTDFWPSLYAFSIWKLILGS